MTTREIIIQAVFEGKLSHYSISDKFGFELKRADTNSLVKYVDAVITRRSLSDKLGSIENDVYVTFSPDKRPRQIEFNGTDENGEVLEIELKLEESGEVFHWRVVKL